jgi:predicted DNA-binding transcriptional regulator AlpA
MQRTGDLPQLLSVNEVAELLCLSKRSVWRYAATGRLPPPLRLGGVARWNASELRRFVAQLEAAREVRKQK